jgi:hypothetical protein
MEQPLYIDRNFAPDPSLDFKFLRSEGIRIVQQLAGSFWTDFNVHDPGVTILEQLCFALTELSFRTNYAIEQHLFNEGKDNLPFFTPEDILTNSPLSCNDLRKLFLDSIPEIKNIWFEPCNEEQACFNGLFKILVDSGNISIKPTQLADDIINKIRGLYSKNRNLGEDLHEISLLEHIPVKIEADIETDGIHELEKILSKIYFLVEQCINPEVRFYSLGELVAKGKSYNEIFDGPKLQHGFILTEELLPQPDIITVSDIVKLVMQIEGVVSVKRLNLLIDNTQYINQYQIPAGKIPKFITSEVLSDEEVNTIRFFRGDMKYSGFNYRTFRRHLNEMVSENKKSYRISEASFEFPDITQGLDFKNYFSIQNHFPAIYGLGVEGLPNKPNKKQLAKVKQLKGYLVMFEQLMANYLTQLSHFKDLLSIQKRQDKTNYSQLLDIPNPEGIFSQLDDVISDVYIDFGKVPKSYKKGLPALTEIFDNSVDRKNRLLDFLLATHGESFTRYSMHHLNYYFDDAEYNRFKIQCKAALLQLLSEINYTRSSGINYYEPDNNLFTGLEKRLSILLGIGIVEDEQGHINLRKQISAFNAVKNFGIQLIDPHTSSAHSKKWFTEANISNAGLTSYLIQSEFDYIDDEDLAHLTIEDAENIELPFLLPFRTKVMLTDFLQSGIELLNYKLGKCPGEKTQYALVHRKSDDEDWLLIGTFDTDQEALRSVKALISKIKKLNLEMEGMHLVEHILLRPQVTDNKFGIYLNDADGKHILISKRQYTLDERKTILSQIEKGLTTYDNYSVVADENRDMNIVFKIQKNDIQFTSINPRISVEETHTLMEKLYRYLANKDKNTGFQRKIGFYVQYDEKSKDIPEEFFSHRISLVLPGWTARFSNSEFRLIVNDLVIEQKPAGTSASLIWLNPGEMKIFEKLHKSWLKSNVRIGNAELAKFIYQKLTNHQ